MYTKKLMLLISHFCSLITKWSARATTSLLVHCALYLSVLQYSALDLGDGQFSERCDVDGSFFNNDAIPIIFGKA